MPNLKEFVDFNKIMLGVIAYLVVDLHQEFKKVVGDVQELKETVHVHSYRLNVKPQEGKRDVHLYSPLSEAILPSYLKIKKIDDKAKFSDS